MDALALLTQRNSTPRLSEPAPTPEALARMIRCALRAPDHAYLRPARFLIIEGESRQRLGQVFADALRRRKPDASDDEIQKNRIAPLRAPLLVVVIAQIKDNPKVPAIEQRLTAGCAAHGLLLAAQALGFGAIWRTGDNAYDPGIRSALGLADNEEISGYIYIGTPSAPAKPLPELNPADFMQVW